jgi:hypothetical protein
MGWLRRWDENNKQWAERIREKQNEPATPPGLGDRIISAYVTYKLITWAVVLVLAVVILVVRLFI